jgi:hypothetical protein
MNNQEGDFERLQAHRLSAHELAALMLLDFAPVAAEMRTLDIVALYESGLAELVEPGSGGSRFFITRKGKTVLQMLIALLEQERGDSI